MESSIDRLDKYLKKEEINDNQFTVKTKIAQGWIGKARERKSSITEKTYNKIFKAFPNLNESWLKTGEGNMYKVKGVKVVAEPETFYGDVEKLQRENKELREKLELRDEAIANINKELSELKDQLIKVLLNQKK